MSDEFGHLAEAIELERRARYVLAHQVGAWLLTAGLLGTGRRRAR
jgi:hypothetical protein